MVSPRQLRHQKELLDRAVEAYNKPSFIEDDPISVPHQLSSPQDIEIIAFWTALLSWGRRSTIIQKANQLLEIMDYAPHQFVLEHQPKDLQAFEEFKHRTFQYTDTLYFISFFRHHYSQHDSLEDAFLSPDKLSWTTTEQALDRFYHYFFSLENVPHRTRKHVSAPHKKSSCKRINMFLRWMVRKDNSGVDFGLWDRIPQAELLIPLDVHVARVANSLGLYNAKNSNWKAVQELTAILRLLDPSDPVKYDYALFGIGVNGIPS